jgi:branched-subunit amino acid aminotransferase/4-amino-4-deoxychorismate lyase
MSVEREGELGLVETIRARGGRIPWLQRHLARLRASLATLGLPAPTEDIEDLVRIAAGSSDRVVRLELRGGDAEISTREINTGRALDIIVASQRHHSYPHKTTARAQFGRALSAAKRAGADDAVLVTPRGELAEGTAWNLFWWDRVHGLCTPPLSLGILPGIGRARIMELGRVTEMRLGPADVKGRSLFVVNAVRGVCDVKTFEGTDVPEDPRTAELSAAFWPD